MTLKEYLTRCRIHVDGVGDVLRLARQDTNLPEITSLGQLEAYLKERQVPAGVAENARKAWARFQSASKRLRRDAAHSR